MKVPSSPSEIGEEVEAVIAQRIVQLERENIKLKCELAKLEQQMRSYQEALSDYRTELAKLTPDFGTKNIEYVQRQLLEYKTKPDNPRWIGALIRKVAAANLALALQKERKV